MFGELKMPNWETHSTPHLADIRFFQLPFRKYFGSLKTVSFKKVKPHTGVYISYFAKRIAITTNASRYQMIVFDNGFSQRPLWCF